MNLLEPRDVKEIEKMLMSKVVRVSLTGSAFKRIQLLPLNEQGLEILKQHDMNAEEAFGEVYDQLWSENSEQLMEFMFADAYSEMGLCVTDNETDEELYCEDYETDPNYGLMSLEAALENYEDDKEELTTIRLISTQNVATTLGYTSA